MKNKDYTIIIRIALIIGVIYFFTQSSYFNSIFGEKEIEEASTTLITTEKNNESVSKRTIPELLENPSTFKEDFFLLLKAYKEAWFNKDLEIETYDKIVGKKKVMEALNWLMAKREEGLEVPLELSMAVEKYINENEEDTSKIAGIFSENDRVSLVREYADGSWKVKLKHIQPQKLAGDKNSEAEKEKESGFKVIGVD